MAIPETPPPFERRAHSHYFKDIGHLRTVDVYRVLSLFGISDPCLQHAAKKILVAGGRGAGKDIHKDIQEAIDTLVRWQEMQKEDAANKLKQDSTGYMGQGDLSPQAPKNTTVIISPGMIRAYSAAHACTAEHAKLTFSAMDVNLLVLWRLAGEKFQ